MSTMKKVVFAFSVLSLAAVPVFAQNNAAQLEANKKLAQRFFDIGMRDPSKLAEIIHPDYIQHNPMFQRYNEEHGTKGLDGMMKFIQTMMAGRGAGPGPGPGGPPPHPRVRASTWPTMIWLRFFPAVREKTKTARITRHGASILGV